MHGKQGAAHWLPLVFGPAFAMERMPGPVWLSLKFSSANLQRSMLSHPAQSANLAMIVHHM